MEAICLFVFLYVGSYLLIYEFESWITGVCSPYVVSLCSFAYYVHTIGTVYVGGWGGKLHSVSFLVVCFVTGQVGLGVGSWPSNRATEGSNPKETLLYFVILLKNVEKNL